MSAIQIRRRAKRRIDTLSPDRLAVADDFLSYLQERDTNGVTEELLRIPGFVEAFDRGSREVQKGHTTPVEKLRRKY